MGTSLHVSLITIIISSTLYFLTGQFQDLLRAVLVPRGMSLKFPMATRDPQKSGACIVLEQEKAILLAKKRQKID